MEEEIIAVWKGLERAGELLRAGNRPDAQALLRGIDGQLTPARGFDVKKYKALLEDFSSVYRLDFTPAAANLPVAAVDLDDFVKTPKPGISLVTCCRNRVENLLHVLPGWLACGQISEVVIVDWTSTPPVFEALRDRGFDDPRLKILRVEGESRWVLPQAFNAGFRAASCRQILKVDADIMLDAAFFESVTLKENTFVSGNWRLAGAGQEFINGVFLIARKDLMRAGGFNEFITTYGWDDDDLYLRLQELGLERQSINSRLVRHLPHDDTARLGPGSRAGQTVGDRLKSGTQFRIVANKFMTGLLPTWTRSKTLQPFAIAPVMAGLYRLWRRGPPPHRVPAHIRADAEYYAALHILSWKLDDPRVLELDREGLGKLLQARSLDSIDRAALDRLPCPAPAIARRRKRLFVDAQHGLGNRLRAIASGAVLADRDGRELVIVWQPDHHCDCSLRALFDYDGALIGESFPDDARKQGMAFYNYMEAEAGAKKDALIDLRASGDIYARSAYALNTPLTDWAAENAFLKGLRVSAGVLDLMAGVRRKNTLGVHIRMEGGRGLDSHSYERPENWTPESHAKLHYWRARSHFSHFMKRIDGLVRAGAADSIFLATDRAETYAAFQARYGRRIAFLERGVFDRSALQIRYALADVLLLRGCGALLGSSWSSFTELALRLSDNFSRVEMSGRDF